MLTTVPVSSVSLTGLPKPNWTHLWRELLPSPWRRGVDLAGLLGMTTMPPLTEPTVELESGRTSSWSPSGWKRLDHPLAWLPDSPALLIRPLPLLEEVLDHRNRPGHQNVTVNCVMTPPSKHLLCCLIPQLWSGRPLWQGRHLWSSHPLLPSRPLWLVRPLWPGRCLWLIRDLWSGRCLWPCRCALPARQSWSSRRSLPGPHLLSRPLPAAHLLSRPLPGPGLELLGPIQYESVELERQPLW